MDIQNIFVKSYKTGSLNAECEGITHIKTLPFLSVVQSVKGSYDISLGKSGEMQQTGEGGVFISPSGVVQKIVHHTDSESGVMVARWLFLDVTVNGGEPLDGRFDFPVLLPPFYRDEVNRILDNLFSSRGICRDLSDIYLLLDILLGLGVEKSDYDSSTQDIIAYIGEHFGEKIIYKDFADKMHISVSGLYRKFKREFNETPSEYINHYRILRAAYLLENKNLTIKEIAFSVGFCDEFYFSKLFKHYMKIPPVKYRENIEGLNGK